MIEEGLLENCGITGYRLIKQFVSKKNDVYLIEAKCDNGRQDCFVIKCFGSSIENIQIENHTLNLLQKVNVRAPRIIYRGKTSLLLEYIPGEPLVDVFCSEEALSENNHLSPSTHKIINQMCNWLKGFYTLTPKELGYQAVLGDPNFRNFILNSELYGIDFEEVQRGEAEKDIGRLCAFALTYDKPFTEWKHAFVDCFVDRIAGEMNLDRAYINQNISEEIEKIRIRRESQGKILPC